MYRVLYAVLLATILSILFNTAFFLAFGFHGINYLASDFVIYSQTIRYWIGLGIFSLLYFALFTLPITFWLIKE